MRHGRSIQVSEGARQFVRDGKPLIQCILNLPRCIRSDVWVRYRSEVRLGRSVHMSEGGNRTRLYVRDGKPLIQFILYLPRCLRSDVWVRYRSEVRLGRSIHMSEGGYGPRQCVGNGKPLIQCILYLPRCLRSDVWVRYRSEVRLGRSIHMSEGGYGPRQCVRHGKPGGSLLQEETFHQGIWPGISVGNIKTSNIFDALQLLICAWLSLQYPNFTTAAYFIKNEYIKNFVQIWNIWYNAERLPQWMYLASGE